MKTIRETEVVVVGGGAVGCSIAYQLKKRGKDVVLVEKNEPGSGTSSFNFGLVWTHTKEPYTYMELNLASSLLFTKMAEELGEDVELRQGGGLRLCATEAAFEKASQMIERQRRSPLYRGRMLSTSEVLEMQPGVSPDIAGASWSPDDGDVNWAAWTQSLIRGCQRIGVTILSQTEVTGFELDSDQRVTGVLTSAGRIGATYAVNAAGPWAQQIAAMVDVHIDVYPLRGQVLVTEATEIICPRPMSTVRQDRSGRFFLGSTSEDVGFDWSTTEEAARIIREKGRVLVPKTAELAIERQFAGLRPQPRDGKPLLGPVPRVPGFFVAVSHSGITLSPIHGKVITDLIVDGYTSVPLQDYDPLRFEKAKAAEPKESGGSLWAEAVG